MYLAIIANCNTWTYNYILADSAFIDNLPGYARPVFIRVLDELPTTTTHKLQKNDLRDQAYHLEQVDHDLLVLKPGEAVYRKLDSDFYDKIIQRDVSF